MNHPKKFNNVEYWQIKTTDLFGSHWKSQIKRKNNQPSLSKHLSYKYDPWTRGLVGGWVDGWMVEPV